MRENAEPVSINAVEDDLDEVDLTEDEFDAQWSAGEPVVVIGYAAPVNLRSRIEDYYTLAVSDPRVVAASAGRWGGNPASAAEQYVPLLSST